MKNIVVIGGGTGTSVVLSGLKKTSDAHLTAIVVVTDSGGSTGRLRDEFGFLPVGDLRQGIVALADGKNQDTIRQLLLYRFKKGEGLKGHNLGNLILTALEDIKDSPGKAIEAASKIFHTKGKVYPVTEENIELIIHYQDGSKKVGEHFLDDHQNGGKKIKKIAITKPAKIYHKASKALKNSDLTVMGPGDLYASLLPNTLAQGFSDAIKSSSSKFVYVVNLMTHYSQTHDMSAMDHITEITKYTGRKPDVIIMNNGEIPPKLLQSYADQKEFPVADDIDDQKFEKVIRDDFVSKVTVEQQNNDTVQRSLLRHDKAALAKTLLEI